MGIDKGESITRTQKDMNNIMKLHILYLEKLDGLSDRERSAYMDYFNHLARPAEIISGVMAENVN